MTEPQTSETPYGDLVECEVCHGCGMIPEPHEGGYHLVHCTCTYRRPCDLMCRCSGGPL